MKNRGFTLIELLVVIILIAAIVLLVLPNITNSVNNYNINVDKTTLNIIKQATNLYISDNTNSFMKRSENTYCISLNELIEKNYLKNTIQYNDQDITNVKVVKVTYENGFNYELVNKTSCKKVIKFDTICELKEGTDKTIGSKYNCKVDPDKALYTFYVLSYNDEDGNIIKEKENAKSINLIMDRNINSDGSFVTKAIPKSEAENGVYNLVEWINQGNYELAGGQNWDDYIDNNIFGPLTAMNFLSEATKNWKNINEMLINSFDSDDSTIAPKGMKVYNTYARMPYYSEVFDVSADKMWLIDYLHGDDDVYMGIEGRDNAISGVYGYWTLSADSTDNSAAWRVMHNVSIMNDAVADGTGIRPVINLEL